jgi:acetyl esterase
VAYIAPVPDLRTRALGALLRAGLNLPASWQRRLARPLVIDGLQLSPELRLMFLSQRALRIPEIASIPLTAARAEMDRQTLMAGGRQHVGAIRDLEVDGGAGPIPARLYIPTERTSGDPAPTLLFVHGGGWIYGGLPSHDAACRVLAERSGVQLLAIDYRLAPEHPFPAALEDCKAALRWLRDHAEDVGADPARIGVGGDSAGGNLSAVLAVYAAEQGIPLGVQLLIYPGTDFAGETLSKELFSDKGLVLTQDFIDKAKAGYLPEGIDWADPEVSPLRRTELPADLAPAHVVTAGFDPLRDEGEAYADHLAGAGVPVTRKRYASLTHGFMHVVGTGHECRAAVGEMADRLRAALG